MNTSNHRETSGEFEFPGSRLAADLRQQSIAMNRFMNKFGGYKSGSTGAVDSVAFINGAPGNCFAATIPIVEEFRTYEMRQGIPNKTGFFIGFPSDHGKKQSNGSIRASHTTLFAVDPSTLTVVEANLMGYENLDPTVLIEQDLSQVLQDLDSTDLTVLNSDPDFRETYSVTKEGNQVDFKIYEYQDAIYNYLKPLGKLGLFALEDVRTALTSHRHFITGGLVVDPALPIDTLGNIPLHLDEDF